MDCAFSLTCTCVNDQNHLCHRALCESLDGFEKSCINYPERNTQHALVVVKLPRGQALMVVAILPAVAGGHGPKKYLCEEVFNLWGNKSQIKRFLLLKIASMISAHIFRARVRVGRYF